MTINNKKKKKLLRIAAVCLVLLAGTAYALFRFTDVFKELFPKETEASELSASSKNSDFAATMPFCTATPVPSFSPTPKPKIAVHICGNVVCPGVVFVDEGTRLSEAIVMAGGFSWSADTDYLNLARVLSDGERVWVPSYLDTEGLSLSEKILGENTDEAKATPTDISFADDIVININTASAEELIKLPGIGESRARDIIAYRTKVGDFEEIADIMNVSGIGEAMFNRIKDMIRVE